MDMAKPVAVELRCHATALITFMSRINFMFGCDKHEQKFITSKSGFMCIRYIVNHNKKVLVFFQGSLLHYCGAFP